MLFILDGDTQRSGTETELSEYDSQDDTSVNEGNRKIEVLEHDTTSSSTTHQGLDFATPPSKTKRQKKIGAGRRSLPFFDRGKGKIDQTRSIFLFWRSNCLQIKKLK
ncbi:unnamed protein product [Acanthoscelides obtectus]|uniref:Uncharacterized protein n=1 Tax=Acanthoscelides obtectus TaxID=200917 RepID=A0A9P0JWI8_ACAOB|nr:unnamed protein product [Acanthoscelides obtectus]CAK1623778.1 hypothetical protein AOBTE_LOCUS2176 [Acanthoscelides obtectus]